MMWRTIILVSILTLGVSVYTWTAAADEFFKPVEFPTPSSFYPPYQATEQSSSSSSSDSEESESESESASTSTSTSSATSGTTQSGVQSHVTNTPQGTFQVTTNTPEEIRHVEYYSQNKYTGTETYLGTGQRLENKWKINVDSAKRLPNGEYQVVPHLERRDGEVVQGAPVNVRVEIPEEKLTLAEKVKFEISEADTDADGISDREEIRFGSNPKVADTDKDGFLDGDEIKNGFNPTKFSGGDKSDRITFESPKEIAEKMSTSEKFSPVDDGRFVVHKIEKVDTESGKKVTRFSGKALPDIFITVYIYSDPIIVTVKTDSEGNWTYDLDKELPDGDHEVYVAVTDNVGKITAQSSAVPFIKTAEAINIKPAAAASPEAKQNASPLERSKAEVIIMAIIIATSFLGIALVLIGRRASSVQP